MKPNPGGARRGWFILPGQKGDREVADQLRGLELAVEHVRARGSSVLDLGCAEGAIALEFARAGARRILGLEVIAEHLEVARQLCAGFPCEFRHANLNDVQIEEQFDVVLALAIIHKLRKPAAVLRHYANLARELVVVRMPAFSISSTIFRSERFAQEIVDVARILGGCGFALERVERGPWLERGHEPVIYFRRIA